jgi:hypothetical protein
MEAEGAANMREQVERASPSTQGTHRRRIGGEVAAAAGRMGVEDGVAAALVRVRKADLLGDSMIARTAQAEGERRQQRQTPLDCCSLRV